MNIPFIKLGLYATFLFGFQNAMAQDIIDIGKYGQNSSYSTARSIGFGNALGSVGGDFSSLSVNPAGIGVYRSSEFMMTPGLRFSGANSSYNGGSNKDNNVRFGFNNLGLVFTSPAKGKDYEKADWKSVSFGLGVNRTAEFSRTYNYQGQNNQNSASQYFEGDARNYPSSTTDDPGTPAYLGYQSYLLGNGPDYTSYVPIAAGINQRKTVQERGGTSEIALSMGGNYQEKLLIGATVGIPVLRHIKNTTMYEETINPASSNDFDNFTYNENITTRGSGINLKLGAIYKFSDYFRAGIAFHTPTIYTLTEQSDNDIITKSANFGTNIISTAQNQYDYSIITPFKAVASATAMLGKYGFVSLDYEYVNYSSMRYRFEGDQARQNRWNADIKNLYGSASNLRAGLEIKLDQLFLRTGFGFYGSPYNAVEYQGARSDISFGIGYRFSNVFIDFGIINSSYSSTERPYILTGALGYTQPNFAAIKNNLSTGLLTVGWKL